MVNDALIFALLQLQEISNEVGKAMFFPEPLHSYP